MFVSCVRCVKLYCKQCLSGLKFYHADDVMGVGGEVMNSLRANNRCHESGL